MGVKKHLLWDRFSGSVIALPLLALIISVCFERGSGDLLYWTSELNALQALLAAWRDTPDLSTNLDGWSTTQPYPCMSLSEDDATVPNWRGVQCSEYYNGTVDICAVVSLSISNASIVGILPTNISKFSYMTTLELTGNPALTGELPEGIEYMWLNVLDVHDNSFTGIIPMWNALWNLLQLDLSGNQFIGDFPFAQLRTMDYLQVLSIGNNKLSGTIPSNAFVNKTELEKLDISHNHFTGALPDLLRMRKLIYLDVSGNAFVGSLPDLRTFNALKSANFGSNKFTWTGNLQNTFNLNAKLRRLDLSNNSLTGLLPLWDSTNLGTIQELYLHNNSLSGELDLIRMNRLKLLQTKADANSTASKLRVLSLSNNKISRVIFDEFTIQNVATIIKLDGNPYCDHYDSGNDGQRCFCNQICFVNPVKSNNRKVVAVSVSVSVVLLILILGVVVGILLYKNRRYKKYLQVQFSKKFEEYDVKPTIFSYNELRAATRDFHDDMKLGQGGYGAVFKGILPNGNVVAVKQLFVKTSHGLDEFSNEVVLITGMKHRNLVNLKGCCLREHQRLLVYEYVDNFDVNTIVLGPRRQLISWPNRLNICLGVARGLHYLHALAQPRVIHRDIKASNILLDKSLEPKIADFGLALLFPDEQTHIVTVHVAGTKGYLAPEYASLGQLSDKVDVYSFGVLCLEIISGRHNICESSDQRQMYLSQWAWLLHEQDRLLDLVDPALHLTDDDVREVLRILHACLMCIQTAPDKRPSMARIVSILQNDTDSEVQVLSEGTSGPAYNPGTQLNRGSVDYGENYGAPLDSVSEEEGRGGSKVRYHGPNRPRRGTSDRASEELNVPSELSRIQAR